MSLSRLFMTAFGLLLLLSGLMPVLACGPQAPDIVPDRWLLHRDHWFLPYTGSRWQDGLVTAWEGNDHRRRAHLASLGELVSGSYQKEFDELDRLILKGQMDQANKKWGDLKIHVDQISFSARPQYTPLRFLQRRLWHRRQVLDLLSSGPPLARLADYLSWRQAYETPLAQVIQPSGPHTPGTVSYGLDPARMGDLKTVFLELQAFYRKQDPAPDWISLLTYDLASLHWATGEKALARQVFAEAAALEGPARARARFMEARLQEEEDPGKAASTYRDLLAGPMAPEALLRLSHLAHRAGRPALALEHYRAFWVHHRDHPDLVHIERSTRDLLDSPDAAMPASLKKAFSWMARRSPRPETLEIPEDPFFRWLQRRWTVRALYRDGEQSEALALAEILLDGDSGRSDRAFVGNLWSNLLWSRFRYDPDMVWGDPTFPVHHPVEAPLAEKISPFLREFAGADWALTAVYHAQGAYKDPLVLAKDPWVSALTFGADPFLIRHLMRSLPEDQWPLERLADKRFVEGRLLEVLEHHPDSPWAERAALEILESLERAIFPWDPGFYSNLGDPPKPQVLGDNIPLWEHQRVVIHWSDTAPILAAWAQERNKSALGKLILSRLKEFEGYQNDSPVPPDQPPRLNPAGEALSLWQFLGDLRQAHLAGKNLDRFAPKWRESLKKWNPEHPLRRLPVAGRGFDLSLNEQADVAEEWRAHLLLHGGHWRQALESYSALEFDRDASLALQWGATTDRLEKVLADAGLPNKVRVEAGILRLRPLMASLETDEAGRIWDQVQSIDGNYARRLLRTGQRGMDQSCDRGPDYIWQGEPRCLDEPEPILMDFKKLRDDLEQAPAGSRSQAEAAYRLARYAYHNTAALHPAAGRLPYERDYKQFYFPWGKTRLPQDLAEGHFIGLAGHPAAGDLAVKARYTLGLMDLKGAGTLSEESGIEHFLTLVLDHPEHPLADDALHWARWLRERHSRPDSPREVKLWQRVQAMNPDFKSGDIALTGGAMHEQKALRIPAGVSDDELHWLEHSLSHNYDGPSWDHLYRFVWRPETLYLDLPHPKGTLPRVYFRLRYDGKRGRQVEGGWSRVDLSTVETLPRLGFPLPAQGIVARPLEKGDVFEVKMDWAPQAGAYDPATAPAGSLLILRGDMRPADMSLLRGGFLLN